jgi:hypothetical protein
VILAVSIRAGRRKTGGSLTWFISRKEHRQELRRRGRGFTRIREPIAASLRSRWRRAINVHPGQ